MIDVVALGELLIDFTCLQTDSQGYPTIAAHQLIADAWVEAFESKIKK